MNLLTPSAKLWLPSRYRQPLSRMREHQHLAHTPVCPSFRTGISMGMEGRVTCSVVDAKTKRVIRIYPEQRNLILNQGLDQIATQGIADCFLRCVAGSGTTDTTVSSGADTAAVSSGTLTVSTTGYLAGTAADVGKTFKIGSTAYRVTAASSTTQATVTPTTDVSATTFTLYNTQQVGLTTELKRTATYLTGAGNCESSWSSPTATLTRTYDFSAESGSVGYNEIGFAYSASTGNNLFSRIKLASTVNLTAGQQLRVKYSLLITLSPTAEETISSSPITGWAGATGKQRLGAIGIVAVNSTGSSDWANSLSALEPSSLNSSYHAIMLSSNTDALATPTWQTATTNRNSNVVYASASLVAYSNYNWYRDKQGVFAVGVANRSDWRSIFLTSYYGNATLGAMVYLLDSNQTKDSLHTLTITFRFSWNRSY